MVDIGNLRTSQILKSRLVNDNQTEIFRNPTAHSKRFIIQTSPHKRIVAENRIRFFRQHRKPSDRLLPLPLTVGLALGNSVRTVLSIEQERILQIQFPNDFQKRLLPNLRIMLGMFNAGADKRNAPMSAFQKFPDGKTDRFPVVERDPVQVRILLVESDCHQIRTDLQKIPNPFLPRVALQGVTVVSGKGLIPSRISFVRSDVSTYADSLSFFSGDVSFSSDDGTPESLPMKVVSDRVVERLRREGFSAGEVILDGSVRVVETPELGIFTVKGGPGCTIVIETEELAVNKELVDTVPIQLSF